MPRNTQNQRGSAASICAAISGGGAKTNQPCAKNATASSTCRIQSTTFISASVSNLTSNGGRANRHQARRFARHSLKGPLRADACQPPGQNRVRLQPRPTWREAVVVGEDRVRIRDVVQVERHHRSLAAEVEILREPEIELVDSIAVHRAGLDQIDRDVRNVS